jgi:uncharacterized repeat protein (TIGR03803 family)
MATTFAAAWRGPVGSSLCWDSSRTPRTWLAARSFATPLASPDILPDWRKRYQESHERREISNRRGCQPGAVKRFKHIRHLVRFALIIGTGAALLAGCGVLRQAQDDTQPPIGAPATARPPSILHLFGNESSYQVLYSFSGDQDGSAAGAGLLNVDGTLYGTTSSGGAYGRGAAYSITTAGDEHVLNSFGNDRRSPASPKASLINVNGTLYAM